MHFPNTLAKSQQSYFKVRLVVHTDFMYLPAENLCAVLALNY